MKQKEIKEIKEVKEVKIRARAGAKDPVQYSDEVAQVILDRLASGETLTRICKAPGMPCSCTIRRWVMDDFGPGFAHRYREARDLGFDAIADECLEIADDSSGDTFAEGEGRGKKFNHEYVHRSRLKFDARAWYLSKLAASTYGQKIQAEVSGSLEAAGLLERLQAARKRTAASKAASTGGSEPAPEPAIPKSEQREEAACPS